MPHQCTTCGHAFEDGSKQMLGGCPECGGNKFQFYPEGTEVPDEPPEDAEAEAPDRDDASAAGAVGKAATAVRDFVSNDDPDADAAWPDEEDHERTDASSDPTDSTGPSDESPTPSAESDPGDAAEHADETDLDEATLGDSDIIDADAHRPEGGEDDAQATARGDLASAEEIAGAGDAADADEAEDAPGDGRVVSEPSGEEPDLAELREELNDQFESIKIVEPGQYELNLMELYEREEYIIALQENGRYAIQVPENYLGERID